MNADNADPNHDIGREKPQQNLFTAKDAEDAKEDKAYR
jgi:hypothetical protein